MKKCDASSGELLICDFLRASLEYKNPTGKSKGLFNVPRVFKDKNGNIKVYYLIQIHSGKFVKNGILPNYCPFCGENILQTNLNREQS